MVNMLEEPRGRAPNGVPCAVCNQSGPSDLGNKAPRVGCEADPKTEPGERNTADGTRTPVVADNAGERVRCSVTGGDLAT